MRKTIECMVCRMEVPMNEVSQYAAFGGLPSPSCEICFEVNDHSCKTLEEVAERSLIKRAELTKTPKP